jgi:hypothetical protein
MNTKPKDKTKRIDLTANAGNEKSIQKVHKKYGTKTLSETIFKAVDMAAERVEYHCDRVALKLTDSNVNFALIHLQMFADEMKKITGQNCTLAELETCLAGLGKLGSTQILQSAITEAVNKKLFQKSVQKYPDLTVVPEMIPAKDLTTLFEISETIDSQIPMPRIQMNSSVYWSCYSMTGGVISVIQSELEKLKSAYRFYAETPDELRRLELITGLCTSINKILEDPDAKDYPQQILNTVYYDSELGRFAPNGLFVKYSFAPKMFFNQ